ncbi:hypothetical protein DFH29DRAFT_985178 [Suillus ampliporus]|nr:hypothetical protein DFH29DRAFT_985178 [Suillus ampliporus]
MLCTDGREGDQRPSLLPAMAAVKHRCGVNARQMPSATDPLVHYGCHFRQMVHALCNFQALLTNGILQVGELAEIPDENLLQSILFSCSAICSVSNSVYFPRERHEHHIFQELLKSVAGLEEWLMQGADDEVDLIAELLTKGASGARGNDTKSLKGSVLDWITPKGQSLVPPLTRNVKLDHGFHHEWTGALLFLNQISVQLGMKTKLRSDEIIVTGDQWPLFLYSDYHYNLEDPWNGLFQSTLLVCAYKHVFKSPSSVDREPKATHSGNTQIHRMTRVTLLSITYIAMQVYTVTNSEWFYNSILDIFEDPDESKSNIFILLILTFSRQIFPSYSTAQHPLI